VFCGSSKARERPLGTWLVGFLVTALVAQNGVCSRVAIVSMLWAASEETNASGTVKSKDPDSLSTFCQSKEKRLIRAPYSAAVVAQGKRAMPGTLL